MKNLKLAPVFMLLMLMLSACNTMEGAGEELEDAANKKQIVAVNTVEVTRPPLIEF